MSCLLYFPRKTTDWEGLFEELFWDYVNRNKENQKEFLCLDDFIRDDNGFDKVIASYFKEVKIKEFWILKADTKRLTSMVSDDTHLLIGEESRRRNFWELQEISTSIEVQVWRVSRKKIQVEGLTWTEGQCKKLHKVRLLQSRWKSTAMQFKF